MTATAEHAAEPATGLTTWERWYAGYEARGDEERRHYREYDAALDRLAEIRHEAEQRAAARRAVLVPRRERS